MSEIFTFSTSESSRIIERFETILKKYSLDSLFIEAVEISDLETERSNRPSILTDLDSLIELISQEKHQDYYVRSFSLTKKRDKECIPKVVRTNNSLRVRCCES